MGSNSHLSVCPQKQKLAKVKRESEAQRMKMRMTMMKTTIRRIT